MTLKEFKETKQHAILLLILENATLQGFKYIQEDSEFRLSTEKHKFSANFKKGYACDGNITATIIRPDNNSTKTIQVGSSIEIKEYISELYYSDKYAYGKWLKSSDLDWSKIEGI